MFCFLIAEHELLQLRILSNVTLSTLPNFLENIKWSELGKNLKAKKVLYVLSINLPL